MNPLLGRFPGLSTGNHRIASAATPSYNCVAWAAAEDNRWWWPDPMEVSYWPPGIERTESIEAFIAAFSLLGYTRCEGSQQEAAFEKIALYLVDGRPTHMARQLKSGRWTSKLGSSIDMEHGLMDLAGNEYGSIVVIMRRSAVNVSSKTTGT